MKKQNFDTLLCFTDGNELHIGIGALIIKPHKEVILISEDLDKDYVESIEELLKDKGLHCRVSLYNSQGFNYNAEMESLAILVNECKNYEEYKLLLDVAKGGVELFYADVSEGQVFALNGSDSQPLDGGPVELEVDEVLEVSGYNIQTSTEEMMKSEAISDMLSYIAKNTELWDVLRRMIKNNYVPNGDWTQFGTRQRLDFSEGSAMRSFVGFLEEKKYLTERVTTKNRIHLKIPDPIVRTFIQTTGLWLEALTYRALHELPFIDDTKADVRFLWSDPPCTIANEIDVMATADSRMLLISCKDMENISTSVLNELEVYSNRIAGDKAVKLLVTAKKPTGRHIYERAEAMGINIVWYNHNVEKFAHILKMILERELASQDSFR